MDSEWNTGVPAKPEGDGDALISRLEETIAGKGKGNLLKFGVVLAQPFQVSLGL